MSLIEEPLGTSIKKVCVTQRNGKYFYPPTIPKERGPHGRQLLAFIICLLFSCILLRSDNILDEIGTICYFLCLFFICQIIIRTCLFIEELDHLKSRYESETNKSVYLSSWKAFKDTFICNLSTLICIIVVLIYLVYFWSTKRFPANYKLNLFQIALDLATACFILYLLDAYRSPLSDSYWIANANGLDYGSGMAYSYFYGYLKYVLENTGTADKNLKELMQDYEDANTVRFASYKLFILIPKSLTFFTILSDCLPNSIIEYRKSLDEKIKDVAGVRQRVYKNSVYSINIKKGDPLYVVAEYASPLKTFRDVVNMRSNHNTYYNKHKNDILLQFYLTLKRLLQEQGLSRNCELIFYDDKDEHGKLYDVGKIILNRLKELFRDNQKKKND